MLVNVKINNMEFQEDSSLTILQVAKKHGIRIPNLCYMMKEEVDLSTSLHPAVFVLSK